MCRLCRYLIAPPYSCNVFYAYLKSVWTEWTCHRRVWHTSNSTGGKNWISSSVLMCNLKQSGCIHPPPASLPPLFAPCRGDLDVLFRSQRTEFLKLQPDTGSICVSWVGCPISHRSGIKCPAVDQWPFWFHWWTWGYMHTLCPPKMFPDISSSAKVLLVD